MSSLGSLPAPLPAPPPLPAAPLARLLGPVRAVGRAMLRLATATGAIVAFVRDVAVAAKEVGTWRPHVAAQCRFLGVDSLPIGIGIAIFTGIVLALLASYSFTNAVPVYFVGTLVEKTLTLELAPVLTGLALAGRVGANIAAELGTMRVTEQVDALETLAYDPLAYLVVPRIIAGVLMFPLVVGVAMITGMAAGWLASLGLLDMSNDDFVRGLRLFFGTFDIRYGLVKAASFGAAVTLLGSMAGLATRGGAQGVGQAATRAVVQGAVAILVLDAFWAVTWLLGRTR